MQHDGTDLNYSFAGTTDFNFSGLTGNVVADSGAGFTSTLGAGSITIAHDGTDVNITHGATTDWNVSGVTEINLDGGIILDIQEMADPVLAADPGRGRMWVRGDSPNVLVFTDDAGTDWDLNVAGSAVAELNDLTDVTLTAPANNSLLYRSGGVYIDSNIANLSFDGTNLTATQIGGIPAANLINRTAPGTISGVETHTADLTMSGADINLATNDIISWNGGANTTFTDNATNFTIDGGASVFLVVTDFSGGLLVQNAPVWVDGISGEAIRLVGNFASTSSSNDLMINFRGSGSTLFGSIGSPSGTRAMEIRGQATTASDSVVIYGNASVPLLRTTTALIGRHSGNNDAFVTQNPVTAGNTTSLTIYDGRDVTTVGGGYDVGYNGTPSKSDTTGSFTVDYDDMGKYCRITTGSSTVTLPANANIPVGGSFIVHNDTTGNISITETSGTQIEFIDGSGADNTAVTYTLARNSICTIRKKDGTTWQIWGNGIS